MSNNEMVTIGLNQLPATGLNAASDLLSELTKSNEFLTRIQLYTKGGAIDRGLISPGHYGVPDGDESIKDLGVEIDILPLCCRPKALDLRDKDTIVTNYDPSSETFKTVKELSGTQDSGCMYGLTFLVFERSTAQFYELFCGTKSMRTESDKIVCFLPLPKEAAESLEEKKGIKVEPHGPLACTLKAKYVTKRNWGWHVPVCVKCSTPFTNLPPIDRINAEITKFMTAANTEIEKVEAAPASKRAR
jgi:hypothetical protein